MDMLTRPCRCFQIYLIVFFVFFSLNAHAGWRDFLNIFEPQQRQAILNALNLMDQVEATVEAIPDDGIDGQQPDYERSICPFSSIYHHWLASLAAPLAGDREVEVTDLVGEVASEFFQSLQQQAMMWRFTIKDRPEGQ